MIIQVDPEYPLKKDIKYAVNILSRGGVIAYPTDTIYGIGCDLMNKDAIESFFSDTSGFWEIFLSADIIAWLSWVNTTLPASAKYSLFLDIASLING